MPELYLSGKWLGKEKPRCHVKHLQSLVKHCLQVFSPPWKKQCPPQSPSVAANHYIIGSELPQPPAQQPPCETRIISQFSRRRIPMIPASLASLASLASAPSPSREVRPRRGAEQEIPTFASSLLAVIIKYIILLLQCYSAPSSVLASVC